MLNKSRFAVCFLLALPACIIPVAPRQSGQPSGGGGGYSGGGGGGQPEYSGGGGGTEETYSGGGNSAPAAASPVSVTIRSACSQTVKVFYGDKPKYGSGTYSTISSNSVNSHSFMPGDMFWIVDDSENGISSASIASGTREIEITSNCAGFNVR